jgi:hypothetical protein
MWITHDIKDVVACGAAETTTSLISTGSPPRVLPGGVVSLTLTPASLGAISAGAYTVDQGRSTTVLD